MLAVVISSIAVIAAAVIGAWAVLHGQRRLDAEVELVDVSVQIAPPEFVASMRREMQILDIKMRNVGDLPAVLTRMVVEVVDAVYVHQSPLLPELLPEQKFSGAGFGFMPAMEPTASYDLSLPWPDEAVGYRGVINLNQSLPGRDVDRFTASLLRHVGFGCAVYLLRLQIDYNEKGRRLSSPAVAVGFPLDVINLREGLEEEVGPSLDTSEVIQPGYARREVERYLSEVEMVRARVEQELATGGQAAPDWRSPIPPERRDALLAHTTSMNLAAVQLEEFWDSGRYAAEYLDGAAGQCRTLIEFVARAHVVSPSLLHTASLAEEELDDIRRIQGHLSR